MIAGGRRGIMGMRVLGIAAVIVVCGAAGCTTVRPSALARVEATRALPDNVYLLDFDHRGRLVNPAEVVRAERDIRNKAEQLGHPRKLLVMSLGWNYDRDGIVDKYRDLIAGYTNYICQKGGLSPVSFTNNWDVLVVSWDSSQRGLRRLMNDLVPTPNFNDAVSAAPDKVLFPFSFWSKAALADHIGYGDLRSALNGLLEGLTPTGGPPCVSGVYLVGHSFGGRIVSGAINPTLGAVSQPAKVRFRHPELIRGLLLLQPAAVVLNTPESSRYPTFITQTRHDHANAFLYPVANLPLNAYSQTGVHGLIGNIPGHTRTKEEQADVSLLGEIGLLPFSVAWTLVATPLNYLYNQAFQLWHRNIQYIPDSLAQIPLLEIPVDLLDDLLGHGQAGRPERWGSRYHGLFGLGAINESAAAATPPIFGSWTQNEVMLLSDVVSDSYTLPGEFRHFIDCSSVMSGSAFTQKIDYQSHWANWTIGWLDPIGAHGDFEHEEIYQLIFKVLSRP